MSVDNAKLRLVEWLSHMNFYFFIVLLFTQFGITFEMIGNNFSVTIHSYGRCWSFRLFFKSKKNGNGKKKSYWFCGTSSPLLHFIVYGIRGMLSFLKEKQLYWLKSLSKQFWWASLYLIVSNWDTTWASANKNMKRSYPKCSPFEVWARSSMMPRKNPICNCVDCSLLLGQMTKFFSKCTRSCKGFFFGLTKSFGVSTCF